MTSMATLAPVEAAKPAEPTTTPTLHWTLEPDAVADPPGSVTAQLSCLMMKLLAQLQAHHPPFSGRHR